MRAIATFCAVLLAATVSFAESGTLGPGEDVRLGNLHVANLAGATGNVDYSTNAGFLTLVVHDGAYGAALKNSLRRASYDIVCVVLGVKPGLVLDRARCRSRESLRIGRFRRGTASRGRGSGGCLP